MRRSRQAAMYRGFTLIELMIALVLMGVLSALAMPRLLDRNALAERAAADELRGLIRSARQIAMAQEREVCLLVAPASVRVVYVSGANCDGARPVPGPGGQGPLLIAAPNNTAFIGDPVLRFNARGQLNPAAVRRAGLGGLLWTVEPNTGAVS